MGPAGLLAASAARGASMSAAVVRRSATVVLSSLLAAVSVAGIVSSYEVSAQTDAAGRAVATANLFQEARYFVAIEDAALNSYRITHLPVDLAAHAAAEASLGATLGQLAASEAGTSDASAVAQLIADHGRYLVLARQVVGLIGGGQVADADALETDQVEPLRDSLAGSLARLQTANYASAVSAQRVAHRNGVLLRWGTPITFGLALLLILGLSRVNRGQRRTVRRQALHDALTGLPNRVLFAERAAQMVAAARRSGVQPVVMMLDLDRFKEVNDTLGHHQGDELLVQVAARIGGLLRSGETVARLGGDEFAMLLADGGPNSGTQAATRILGALQEPFDLDGVSVGVEASIGVATCIDATSEVTNHEQAALLVQYADAAMYQAKADRCGFAHYVPGTEQATHNHLAVLGQLRQAFDRDELVLHYQPKVAADTGELLGVEALVRWQHPTRGLLAPGEFIGLAESTTLIHRLTTVVLDKALAFCKEWLDQGVRMPVAVNVSARSLLDNAFPGNVAAQLAHHGVPANLLWIELTEGTIMADPDKALGILTELRASGVRLSVDDFGTGYSSMAYLKVLPVDELKIDRMFVQGMTGDASDTVLVQSAIDLGHNLGLSVVAEGVEDSATLVALQTLGADVVQGFHLGRPMTQSLLKEWITHRAAGVAERSYQGERTRG
jgi:diguanylate cyclase